MVEGVNGSGSGKEWINTIQDKEYQNALDKKIDLILGNKKLFPLINCMIILYLIICQKQQKKDLTI